MKKNNNFKKAFAVIILCLFTANCTTKLSKNYSTLPPAKTKFGKFKKVEIKPVSISEKFAKRAVNQRAGRRINEVLQRDIKLAFEDSVVETKDEFSTSKTTKEPILQITPLVEEIKYVPFRLWIGSVPVGAIAGGSAVLMKVTFVDSSTGKVIAEPEFYRGIHSHAVMMLGRADDDVLTSVAQDIVNYSSNNK